MFCRKCGKEINNTSRFCPFCGTPVIIPPVADAQIIVNTLEHLDGCADRCHTFLYR